MLLRLSWNTSNKYLSWPFTNFFCLYQKVGGLIRRRDYIAGLIRKSKELTGTRLVDYLNISPSTIVLMNTKYVALAIYLK